jgi:chromatin remodeling complex protein RSC6
MPPAAKKAPVTPAPVETKTAPAKKTVSKKAEPVHTPPPAEVKAPVVDASDDKVDKTGDNILSSLVDKVNNLFSQFKEVQNLIKLLGKEYDKQQKIIDKVQKKRQNAKNSPSGFAKPNKISNELCDFIGVPYGTEKSRTDITRFINAYVKEHNLNKPDNRRFILPDAKLKAILNVKDGEEINYFILQKLISHHFPPSASKQKA